MLSNIIAGSGVVGVVVLAALFAGARADISALEVDIKALREAKPPASIKDGLPPATTEARAREAARKIEQAFARVAALEGDVGELRKSIDWIGQTLAAAAGAADGASADEGGAKGGELAAALTSNDPKKKDEVKRAISKVMHDRREERWQQMSARVNAIENAIVKHVAKEQNWPEAKAQDVLAAIRDFRRDFRKEVREAWRKMENPIEAEKKVQGVLDGARDRLVGLLGANDYETFRSKYNANTDAWQKLRRRSAPKLPAAR